MRRACLLAALAVLTSTLAFAQATSSISGSVIDGAGGAIPGATILVTSESGVSFEALSNGEGLFSVPGVPPGVYSVAVSLGGFKTAVLAEVRVLPGTPASLKAVLEVGQFSETVNVSSSSELINTQNATVASTLNADQLNRMPTASRNALNAVTFLPGINTSTINRESRINGLPESFVSITLDGVSNNDNFLRSSDSFFAAVTPRQDAIEAVNVTTAVQGAQTGGSGAVSINFTTRSGSNQFHGSAYEYWRDPRFNTNYWFNERNSLPKNDVKLNQYGARLGGPIVHDKAFFFAHYEQLRFPNNPTRTRTVLHPRALAGFFRYTVGTETNEVNVLEWAQQNGQRSTVDPTVIAVLNRIRASMATTGTESTTSDPLLNSYVWLSPSKLFEHQPTLKIDYNLTDSHRLTGSSQVTFAERTADYLNNTDARFPGAPNVRDFTSRRPLHSLTLRSTLSGTTVNELRGGITALGGASYFGAVGSSSRNGLHTFDDEGGYALNFDTNIGLTDWFTTNAPSWRSAPTFSVDDSLTWLKGRHSVSVGGAFLRATAWESAQQMVPGIQLGFNATNDPAAGLFTTARFANASAAQLTDARELYGLLTGRVISVTGQAALDPDTNKYVAFGPRRREGRIDMYSAFFQDSWRISPTVTFTGGVRWDAQLPFSAGNDTMSTVTVADVCGMTGLGAGGTFSRCNFFAPNATGGAVPAFRQLTKGTLGYETDWNNVSPSAQIAWRPYREDGFWHALLGDPEQATIRAGYSVAYERQGLGFFTDLFGGNAGSTLSLTRDASTGLVGAGETWPVLLSDPNRLYNAPFPETAAFPIALRPNRSDNLNGFAPDIKVASAHTWNVGIQRSISNDMALEARYIGTRGRNQWAAINYNTIRGENLVNNGFLTEFRNATTNLQANNASGVPGRSGSFAYFGPGTGTTPLPIYLAYLNGSRDVNNPLAYAGGTQTWTSTALAARFSPAVPAPVNSAQDLEGDVTRRQFALAAGLPANFFIPNPAANQVNVTDSTAASDYHAVQLELRRRLSKGLSANVNYQYALERSSSAAGAFKGFTTGRALDDQGNVRHAIKTQWDWTVPIGRGQRFGGDMHPILHGIVGGWSFNGVGRVQARSIDLGNVRLVGMTHKELQKMYNFDIRINPDNGLRTVYMLPDDVILNTRRAFSVSSTTASGYSASLGEPVGRYLAPANNASCIQIQAGDCAPRTLLLRAPWFTRFDVGVTKQFPIHGRANFELRADVLNVLDNINFDPAGATGTNTAAGTGTGIFQATTAYTDLSNTYDPGGRVGQLVFRINW